ncbi:hypothetical protein CO641_14530 [Lysobacteraceae bacterium NML91-0213]|nr:hypothetical protein CO641_14530 [Xanthomonadaceae bacterium NML91-0213]
MVSSLSDLLWLADERGVRFQLLGDALRTSSAPGAVDAALADGIRRLRRPLMAYLAGRSPDTEFDSASPRSLSPAQLGILIAAAAAHEPGAYNVPFAFALRGRVDPGLVERCVQTLVDRHAALRSLVQAGEQGYVQVEKPLRLVLKESDISHLSETEKKVRLDAAMAANALAPFDLERDLLLRAELLCLDADSWAFLLCAHHIAVDGWSCQILAEEFVRLYADKASAGAGLEPPALRYSDFAGWQVAWLQSPEAARQLAYWRSTLQDAPAFHALLPGAPGATGRIFAKLDLGDLGEGLQEAASQAGATVLVLLHAALGAAVARAGGEADVVLGSSVLNRRHRAYESVVGCFINQIALRLDCSGDPSFGELIQRSRRRVIDAQQHQDYPFHRLVELLNPVRREASNPLFQIMINLDASSGSGSHVAADIAFDRLPDVALPPKMDMTLFVERAGERHDAWIEARPDRIDPAIVSILCKLMPHLLRQGLAHPDVPLSQLGWGTAVEARAGDAVELADEGVHAGIERMAEAHPEAEAVRSGEVALSYAELDSRANRIAHLLRSEGVERGALVGVYLERDEWLPAVLLGIWKSGAAWVALDPAQPVERLGLMLEDSGAGWVVARDAAAPAWAGARWIELDSADWAPRLLAMPDSSPGVVSKGTDLAYVLYTSGSTGRPKGVEIEHRNLLHLDAGLWPELAWLGVGERVHWGWNASYGFDASLQGILALRYGGTLHVMSQALRLDPTALLGWASAQGVEVMDVTPSQAQLLLEAGEPLPALVVGGEAIAPGLWTALASRGRAVNVYGPTETTVDATLARIEPGPPHIGQPLAGVMVQVRDMHGLEVPDGVPGELYVGGGGVGRGYRGQPELGSDRFVEEAGVRWYRTGDRGRRDATGRLVYVGRLDDQVKVRGYRVEPGEVAARLRDQPGIAEAHVVPYGDGLWAYVTAVDPAAGSAALHAVRGVLPDYMVPAGVTVLARMPLNENGKLDRDRLPAPVRAAATTGTTLGTAPGALLVTTAIGDLLGVEGTDADANLFAQGAHSLALAQLALRLSRETGLALGLAALFRSPTARGIHQELAELAGGETALDALVGGQAANVPAQTIVAFSSIEMRVEE